MTDVQDALRFLNMFAETTSDGSHMFLPGVTRVQALNRGQGGWIRLSFFGYSDGDALQLARELLLPDPEPVHPMDADVAFEGVPATPRDDGTVGVLARHRPRPDLPDMYAELPLVAEGDDHDTCKQVRP
jgi:hypothetical protein